MKQPIKKEEEQAKKYQATFGIDGGISHGFGLKSPDYTKQEETIHAKGDKEALLETAKKAIYFSQEHLSNPDNDLTTVTILEIFDSNRNLLNQREILKKEGYNSIKRFYWNDNNQLVTECSMLEHLLRL